MKIGWSWAWAVVIASLLPGCGSDESDLRLLTHAEWKEHPGSVAEIGYWISVDFGWPDRIQSCSPLPSDLHVTVDGREASKNLNASGDCRWDVVFEVGPFAADAQQATTVRVLDGRKLLGEATYLGLLPGYPAQLVSPADGRVRVGDTVGLSLLAPLPADDRLFTSARYYWLDPPDSVPPYSEYAEATLASDRQSITVKTPTRTGRAALIAWAYYKEQTVAESCVGFRYCTGWPSETVGPVFVEVVP
jgi:hypothetical protein